MSFFDRFASANNASMEGIISQVKTCLSLYEQRNIAVLQDALFRLTSNFNKPGSGQLIITYPHKEELAECFNLMLKYDWMNDSDIREVWAENGFYCIVDFITENINNNREKAIGSLDLFLLLVDGGDSLHTKFNDVLKKSLYHPMHISKFSDAEYSGGAEYLVREFKYYAAQTIAPIENKYHIISQSYQSEFSRALNDTKFDVSIMGQILQKMQFLSYLIYDVLSSF